jgi:hypothetical protein
LCNLYSVTKGQQASREFTGAMGGQTGNLPPLPSIFPDYFAPIVRNQPEGRELFLTSRLNSRRSTRRPTSHRADAHTAAATEQEPSA